MDTKPYIKLQESSGCPFAPFHDACPISSRLLDSGCWSMLGLWQNITKKERLGGHLFSACTTTHQSIAAHVALLLPPSKHFL